ncbi:MAG: GH3 auxin-responsive promoter family protein [Flavobacteriales bacterium]|jgi:hypothetical protein|nr:GH3 auxin-responsive promoter family protein [Flavobacteriales bacterium]
MNKRIGKPFNSIFSWIIKKRIHQIDLFKKHPIEVQNELIESLITRAKNTEFGKKHHFSSIENYLDFTKNIPIQDYSSLKPYIDRNIKGEQNLLWPEEVKWFAKSSGTTTGKSKFIPVTKEVIEDCHYKGGKDLLGMYYNHHPNTQLFNGKHLILGGSSQINYFNHQSYFGDLSAIIVNNLPWWCEWRRTPKKEITLMENWNEKLPKMVESTVNEDVMILAGVPSWTLVFLKQVLEHTQKDNIMEVWPNLELYMHGGVNFEPYRSQFEAIIKNKNMNYVQTYNASEGFFAIQDQVKATDMLLMLDYGIYYEFLPLEELHKEHPKTLELKDVETGINYALIITTSAGLWRYMIGDTIQFTHLKPHRIIVTGRTSQFINTFGEEVMVDNTDNAIRIACERTNSSVKDYTLAPVFMKEDETGGHEWIIEFYKQPKNIDFFVDVLDNALKSLNSDYEAKRSNDLTIRKPIIHIAKTGIFHDWLTSKDKLGGQHKIPRLSNNRILIEELLALMK